MKKLLLSLLVLTCFTVNNHAQSCFHIESLLVNACGASEGLNEMVRFKVGANSLNSSQLQVNWANTSTPWRGVIQNSHTATRVAEMNAQVQNCGLFLEPINGVLPANATVFLCTSYNLNVSAHSWAGVSDTIYVIFQNANETTGHFSNNPGTSGRTFRMNFTGCTAQSVTYYSGTANTLQNIDGATVNVALNGTVSYSHNGCVAPYTPAFINAGQPIVANKCVGDTIVLTGNASNVFTSFQWTGGSGTFINGNSKNAKYIIGANDGNSLQLTLTGTKCNGTLSSSVNITINTPPALQPIIQGNLVLCPGTTTVLTASGGTQYKWNTGATSSSITVTQAGTYKAVISNSCFVDSAQVIVTLAASPVINITNQSSLSICQGDSVLLTANYNGNNVLWSTGATTSTLIAKNGGTYIASTSNHCGTARDTAIVQIMPLPTLQIQGLNQVCQGTSITLSAISNSPVLWNTGQNTSSLQVNQAGTYSVTASNNCGTITANHQVNIVQLPEVFILEGNLVDTCTSKPITLNAEGNGTISWKGFGSGKQLNIIQTGDYTALATNACGVDSAQIKAFINIIPQVSLADQHIICKNGSVTLAPLFTGNLVWNNGSTNQTNTVYAPGEYYVVAQNANCEPDTAFFSVRISEVDASFMIDSLTGEAPFTIHPNNLSVGAEQYYWSFGNGNSSSLESPQNTYIYQGDYEVVLVATNQDNCTDTAKVNIIVDACNFNTFIPNAFTPNGDKLNDTFMAINVCATNIFITVFNRWGDPIFKSETTGEGWDGFLKDGTVAPQGAYAYLVEIEDVYENIHTFRGLINIMR